MNVVMAGELNVTQCFYARTGIYVRAILHMKLSDISQTVNLSSAAKWLILLFIDQS